MVSIIAMMTVTIIYYGSREDNPKRTNLRITARPVIIFLKSIFRNDAIFRLTTRRARARITFRAIFEFVEGA